MSTTGSGSVQVPASPARPPLPVSAAGRARLRSALPAVAAYAAVRLVGLAVLAVAAHLAGRPFGSLLTSWDTPWYVGIAEDGYDTSVSYTERGWLVPTNIAFFPLFPWLIRALAVVGVSPWVASVVIANVAGLAAAWAIALVGARLADRRVGIVLAVLWGVLPHAVVESMGYTESLFTALCAWALWALLERRFVLAGVLTALAGLSRPTAVALITAVGLACLVAGVHAWRAAGGWRGAGWRGLATDEGWRPWVGLVLAPVGFLGYIVWCGVAVGRPEAYYWMQSLGWGSSVDFGATTARHLAATVTEPQPLAVYLTGIALVIAVLLFVLHARDTLRSQANLVEDRASTSPRRAAGWVTRHLAWWAAQPLLVFAGVLLLTVLLGGGDNHYHAKARLLLPAFPLLLPVAALLARARTAVLTTVLVALTAFSAWYGTYLTMTWTRSP